MFGSALQLTVQWPAEGTDSLHREVHYVVAAVVAQRGAVGWLAVPSLAETTAWFESELAQVSAGNAAVACVRRNGELAGIGILTQLSGEVLRHNGEVRKVMTHPGARGAGVGRAVLLALETRARERGMENLLLDVRGNNHGAMALYESLGWVRCGAVADLIAVGADRFDQINYVLALDRPPGVVLHGQRSEGPGASARSSDPAAG